MADDYGPLEQAIYSKSPELLESLMKTASSTSVKWITEDVSICVHNVECLRILLNYIPSIDYIDESLCGNHTMLTKAADEGRLDCVCLLLDHGANINTRNRNDETALMYACNDKHEEVFDFLIKRGADIHVKGPNGNAVGMAAHKNAVTCLHKLVTLGASIHEKDCRGRTAFSIACCCGHADFVNALSSYMDIDTVGKDSYREEHFYDIDARDDEGRTALMLSCENGRTKVLEKLLKHGPDVNAQDITGKTAVMYATCHNYIKCVQLLLKEGADLDIVDERGLTVLSFAVRGEGEVLEFLLQNGTVLCDGVLNSHHKAGLWKAISEERYFTFHFKSVSLLLEYSIFDWDWCSQSTADPLDTFITPAVRRSICPGTTNYKGFKISMLPLAFALGDAPAIKFLLAHRYFFPKDYKMLSKNKEFRKEMKTKWRSNSRYSKYSSEVTKILKQLTFRPFSLQTWSFLTISKAVSLAGRPTRRADRVDALPLPEQVKKALKFQTNLTEMCPRKWKKMTPEQAFDSLSFKEEITWDKEDFKCTISECLECGGNYYMFKAWVECG